MAELNKVKTPPVNSAAALERVKTYRNNAEANVALSIFKDPNLIHSATLTLDDFASAKWKLCFAIAHTILIKEGKASLDEVTVGFFLEQHPKMKERFYEHGGFDSLIAAIAYMQTDNFESYVNDLKKWKTVMTLHGIGLTLTDQRVSQYADINTEEIYSTLMVDINSAFRNAESSVKAHSIAEDIHGLIKRLNEGKALGLAYYNMPNLSKETGGQNLGSITLLGGISNAGKSTVARSMVVPSILNSNEQVVIIINEDAWDKWQREMLVWICNNVLDFDIQKHVVRDGNYSEEVLNKLTEAGNWLEENSQNDRITLVPFLQYKTSSAIQEIRKYAAQGVKYFILDTFKMDAGRVDNNSWLAMQQAMVDIKDAVKAEALNVHILITFQLEKGSSTTRYYTQNNIGMAKNIVDVASTCIMIRDLYPDEYPDNNNALKVYSFEQTAGKGKIIVDLEKDKKYQLFFVVKNQEGAANAHQFVVEHDKSRNIMREVGYTNLSPDF